MIIGVGHDFFQEPQCKVCRQTPVIRSSKHLFLDLPKVCFSHFIERPEPSILSSYSASLVTGMEAK